MTEISALAALTGTAIAAGDLALVVDVSDLSMAGTGTDKRITFAELVTAFGGAFPVTAYGADPTGAASSLTAINAAVSAARAVKGGYVYFPPGRYDVGAGLALDRTLPVEFRGAVRTKYFQSGNVGSTQYPADGSVLFSSTGAAALVTFDTPSSGSNNGQGFAFHDLVFEATQSGQLYGIRARNLSYTIVDHCVFWRRGDVRALDGYIGMWAETVAASGDDCSWWHVRDCLAIDCGLCQFGDPSGFTASNRHVIRDNICLGTYGGYGSLAAAITTTGATTLTFTTTSGAYQFPTTYPFSFTIDSEKITATSLASAGVLNITRAVSGTTAATHLINSLMLSTDIAPAVALYGVNGGEVAGNNFEDYLVGVYMSHCWQVTEHGNAGERLGYALDLHQTKSCSLAPMGASQPASTFCIKLVRGDTTSYGNVINLGTLGDSSLSYNNWGTYVSLAANGSDGEVAENLVLTGRGLCAQNAAAATTLASPGSPNHKIQVYDQNGTSLGFIPVYASIT